MLIIPIENKPDWTRPPWMTLLLILLNVLVFVFYQSDDEAKMELAYEVYQSRDLLEQEKPHYLGYLQETDSEMHQWMQEMGDGDEQDGWLIYSVMHDLAFDGYVRDIWANSPTKEVEAWRAARLIFEQQRDRRSAIQAGLVPAKVTDKPWTLLTSQFLHGDGEHLLGNMLFLFLFGFALETFLRPWRYLAMYLLSGFAAGGLYLVFATESYVPLVGASGAVSGLMGMYLALYRLRRIRFFYALGFYFGEFRAPALWVFPFWIAKELYGEFFTDTNIAYWAHIGGLLAGAGMMLLVPGVQTTIKHKTDEDDSELALVAGLAQVQRQTAELNIPRARAQAQSLCQRFGHDPRPWQVLFDLHKSAPKSREFHQVTFALLKHWAQGQSLAPGWQAVVLQVLKGYRALAPAAPALTGPLCVALGHRFLAEKNHREAEAFATLAEKKGANAKARLGLLKALHNTYQTAGKSAAAQRMARRMQPQPATAPPTAN